MIFLTIIGYKCLLKFECNYLPCLISLLINVENKCTHLYFTMKTKAFIIYILNSCSVLYLIVYNQLHNLTEISYTL